MRLLPRYSYQSKVSSVTIHYQRNADRNDSDTPLSHAHIEEIYMQIDFKFRWACEEAQRLKAHAALADNLGSVPSTTSGRLKPQVNSSRGELPSGPPQTSVHP